MKVCFIPLVLIMTQGCSTLVNETGAKISRYIFVQVQKDVESTLINGKPYNYKKVTTVDPVTKEERTTIYPLSSTITDVSSSAVKRVSYHSICIDKWPETPSRFEFKHGILRGCFDEFPEDNDFVGIFAATDKLYPMSRFPYATAMSGANLTIDSCSNDGFVSGTLGTNTISLAPGKSARFQMKSIQEEHLGDGPREWEIIVTYTVHNHGFIDDRDIVWFDPHYSTQPTKAQGTSDATYR